MPGTHVLVALSGGLDSVVLLHLLRFRLAERGLRIGAAHFDHAMRADSAADALWVQGLCRAWGVPLVSARATVPLVGETAAREARYRFLHDAAAALQADRIATAHQRDDQAETVLFRLARGTGLAGLAGIPARRGLVVRPLLPFARAELAAYARAEGLRYRDDPSNRAPGPARNRIRHVLLPALERSRPGAAGRLADIAALADVAQAAWRGLLPAVANAALAERTAAHISLARPVLLDYDPRTRARVIRYWAQRLGAPPSRRATAAALDLVAAGQSGRGISLGGGVRLEREFDRIVMCRPARSAVRAGDRPLHIPRPAAGMGRLHAGGLVYDVAWGPDPLPGDWTAAFDPRALQFPLVLRSWQAGDRIPLEYGAKKVKKLFAERRVGRSARASVPVLAEQGTASRVLWIAGLARTSRARVREGAPSWHITVRQEQDG